DRGVASPRVGARSGVRNVGARGRHSGGSNIREYEQAAAAGPPPALVAFLAAGEPPIYVGFGSVVAQDPVGLTRTIFTALERAGARGIVAEGWAHLGGGAPPRNVFLIGDTPHQWLFPRRPALSHHRRAGAPSA